MRGALGFAAVLGLCPFSLVAHADVTGILATSAQKVHPVLIRNERNPVVQVVVESSTSAAVEVDCGDILPRGIHQPRGHRLTHAFRLWSMPRSSCQLLCLTK